MQIRISHKMKVIKFFAVIMIFITCSCKKNVQIFNESLIHIDQQAINHTVSYASTGIDTLYLQLSILGVPFDEDQLITLKFDSAFQVLSSRGILSSNPNITFPAKTYTIKHPILIVIDSIDNSTSKDLGLEAISNPNLAENYRTSKISIYKQSLIDLFSGSYYCSESEYSNKYVIQLAYTNPISDTLLIKNFWDFSTENTEIKFIIQRDTSRSIELPEQSFTDRLGVNYTVYGSGVYTKNGSFYINYTLIDEKSQSIYEEGKQNYSPIR